MRTRGRKSAAEIEHEAQERAAAEASDDEVLDERPEPPPDLSPEDAARWNAIVDELPDSRVRRSDLTLIARLVATERLIRECDTNIRAHGQVTGPGVQVNPAVKLREMHVRTEIALQRALRLCPSMRKRQDDADLGVVKKPGKKPWER